MSDNDKPLDAILGEEFLTWLWYQSDTAPGAFRDRDGHDFHVYMERNIVVQGGEGDTLETASVSGSLSPLREARFGLGTGKKVVRAVIRLEKDDLAYQFSMKAADFSFNSLKTPKLDTSDKDDDPDALFLEKIFLMETATNLFNDLYANFLKLRLSPQWDQEVRDMGRWLARTE